jgi:hypothetical protein
MLPKLQGGVHAASSLVIDSFHALKNINKFPLSSSTSIDFGQYVLTPESNNMALPVVKSLVECNDFKATVLPYLPQLYDLPQQLIQSWNNPTELRNIYLATNPLISAAAFSLALAPIFLLISEINKNYSQVDRMWSLLPTIYNAHYVIYAHISGLPTDRLDNLIAFSIVWSVSCAIECKGIYLTLLVTFEFQLLAQRRV